MLAVSMVQFFVLDKVYSLCVVCPLYSLFVLGTMNSLCVLCIVFSLWVTLLSV